MEKNKTQNAMRAASRDMNKTGQGKKFRAATFTDKKTGRLVLDNERNRKRYNMSTGGPAKKSKFPDFSGDGKTTQKDILMAKGIIPKKKMKRKA